MVYDYPIRNMMDWITCNTIMATIGVMSIIPVLGIIGLIKERTGSLT